jgi:hypothetical protein
MSPIHFKFSPFEVIIYRFEPIFVVTRWLSFFLFQNRYFVCCLHRRRYPFETVTKSCLKAAFLQGFTFHFVVLVLVVLVLVVLVLVVLVLVVRIAISQI